jgi:hypothetical protein
MMKYPEDAQRTLGTELPYIAFSTKKNSFAEGRIIFKGKRIAIK